MRFAWQSVIHGIADVDGREVGIETAKPTDARSRPGKIVKDCDRAAQIDVNITGSGHDVRSRGRLELGSDDSPRAELNYDELVRWS